MFAFLDDPSELSAPSATYNYASESPSVNSDPLGLTIKRCFRAFKNPMTSALAAVGNGLGWDLVQPPLPGVKWCLAHEFLYNTATNDSQGYDPKENIKEKLKGAKCYDIPEPLGQCVWDNFKKISGKPSAYDLTTHNCQTTINQTVTYCHCKGVK